MKYTMNIIWDEEAQVWYSDSSELPVFLNDASYDNLIARIRAAATDVLENMNGYVGPINIIFESVRVEKALVS